MAQLIDRIWNAMSGLATTGWVVLALFALVVIFFWMYFAPRAKKYKPAQTFDSRAGGFRPSQVDEILDEFDDGNSDKLQTYLDQARYGDMVFPILYVLFAGSAIVYLAPRYTPLRWLVLLPFAMAIADWTENLCVAAVIGHYRQKQRYGSLPVLLLIAQRLKWLLLGAVTVTILVFFVGWLRRLG